MMSSKSSTERGNGPRRLYVFLPVALAQFLFAMALIGILCEGFAFPDGNGKQLSEPAGQAQSAAKTSEHIEKAMTEAVEEYAESRRSAHDSMQNYEAARTKLLDYVEQHFAQLQAEVKAETLHERELEPMLSEASTSSSNAESLPVPTKTTPNPQWEKLRRTLAELRNQRDGLLAKLTPSHPTVRAIDLSIAEVEAQIAEMPVDIREKANHATTGTDAIPSVHPALSPANKVDDKQFHVLATAEDAAKKEYQNKLAAETAAWVRQKQAVTEGIQILHETASKPVEPIVSRVTGANVPHAITFSLIWAIIVAWLVASRACIHEKSYETPAEVRQSLDLPVLGMLPSNPHAPREQPRREPRWVKRVVLSSELWLAGIGVLLIVGALLDAQFFHDLIADPLSACSKRFW